MRALHVYSGNMYGGVETLLVTLARHRAEAPGMESRFAVCFEGRLSDELRAAGAPVHGVGPVRMSRPASVLRARRALRELIRRERSDAVVLHGLWPQAVFAPAVRAAGAPLVLWLHDRVHGRGWLERIARLTRPDLAVCNSRFTAATLPRLYAGVRGEVVYCPVAAPTVQNGAEDRRAVRAELDTPEDAVVVVQTSRLEAWKGHSLHLEALGRLREVPGWVCWLVGGAQRPEEAVYRGELEALARRLGIADRVRFAGQRSDVPRILAAADVHCQPNLGPEPFGIAFVEALLAGLPSVTTALGGATEIVDDACGALVPPGDADALAAALRALIVDPAARRQRG
ncbi:MAG TPA: glycosyltransferase, partial [Longimicrobiaceae bacterium]|nr:glycosyltransferase [Longimicrobiaceae bacterium]